MSLPVHRSDRIIDTDVMCSFKPRRTCACSRPHTIQVRDDY